MKTSWLPRKRLAYEDVRDPWNPMQGYYPGIQIGLRGDGVLVWRSVKDSISDDLPDDTGGSGK